MIETLTVRNIALIEQTELHLGRGLNILSGETGAGKSIIIDSLNFVLGERADKSLIRYGTDSASVEAVFGDYLTPSVQRYLDDAGIDPEEILIIRRKMTTDGKNECRINGKVCTLSMLKGLTELLVDIHGQHEHQSLMKVANHIGMLDGMGGDEVAKRKAEVKNLHSEYVALKNEFERFGNESERERKLDVLRFQIDEIKRADIKEGEEDELLDKRKRIRNMEKILSALSEARNILDGYDGNSVTGSLKSAAANLNSVATYDDRISELGERLNSAKYEISDIAETVADMVCELDFDAKSADSVEERLELVRNINRKYGGSYEKVMSFYEQAVEEADALENATERVAQLEKEIEKKGKALSDAAEKLGKLRTKTAEQFETAITRELKDLGMGGTTFKVEIKSDYSADEVGENGGDSVEFLISPNVGEPLKPLAKIISGGEMSRFMLALKNIVAGIDSIGTMVFDEIDTGISGHIAAVVAEKMCNISRNRQVIAVTHMPGLAAMADNHFLIEKSVSDGKTHTHLTLLEDDTEEIARLIGGKDYSSHAVPHAKEMKLWAENYKKSLA